MLSDFECEKWHKVIEYSSKFEMKLKGILFDGLFYLDLEKFGAANTPQ